MAVLAALVEAAPAGLGRTAVMKLAYFLQIVRGVPLGYRFSLYTYGPYDKEVLADLAMAEAEKRVTSTLVTYPGGSQGYEIRAGGRAAADRALAEPHRAAIDWAIAEFARRSAADLEMASTIVFADRSRNGEATSLETLVRQVHEIKPHLDAARIGAEAQRLKHAGLLQSAA
jgi:uncharacterized protein YwgA